MRMIKLIYVLIKKKKMINVAKLLKDCPKETKLYSPLFGEVKFNYTNDSEYGIVVTDSERCYRSFDKYGRFFTKFNNAECLLFPSKDCRTWEGWKLPSEPKFKVGNWAVSTRNITLTYRILESNIPSEPGKYNVEIYSDGIYEKTCLIPSDKMDEWGRPWTITDAKDGDVLSFDNETIVMFKDMYNTTSFHSHCHLEDGIFDTSLDDMPDWWEANGFKPATKEQHDLLFQKMKEAGYEWDKKNKELKKISTESKSKVGDWVVFNDNHNSIYQISEIKNFLYMLTHIYGGKMSLSFSQSELLRPWTIDDAEEGDVLLDEGTGTIGIFEKILGTHWHSKIYCGNSDYPVVYETGGAHEIKVTKPATKEQRDLLFSKMKDAGYTWDDEKKELKKIQPHYDIANFHAGMPVLVRADNNCKWDYSVFSRITGNKDWQFAVCNGVSFTQCIPFNEDTKHLLGTTDMPDEGYINW